MDWSSFFTKRNFFVGLVALAAAALIAGSAWAQTAARLSRTVKDPSGGTVSDATGAMTNQGTNLRRTARNENDGRDWVPLRVACVGRYTVERAGLSDSMLC